VVLDGWFAQVLEGPAAALDACWRGIARDARHTLEVRDARHTLEVRDAGHTLEVRDARHVLEARDALAAPGGGGLRSRERGLCRLFGDQALALRTRGLIPARLLEEFDYRPGFPVEAFPADVLVEFVVQACRREPAPARRAQERPARLGPAFAAGAAAGFS
jgi:hypothetical protein